MRSMGLFAAVLAVLCVASVGFSAETYDAGTKTLTVTADSLAATVDPVGQQQDWDANYQQPAMTKADFNALSGLKTLTFSCQAQFQKTTLIKAYYDATNYVSFGSFGDPTGYNYGGGTSSGRNAHSGTSTMQQLGYLEGTDAAAAYLWLDPTGGVPGHNWFKTEISVSEPGRGVVAIGFIVDGRDDQNTQNGKISLKLDDGTLVQMNYGNFGGTEAAKGLFFGYQAPQGKFITRIECTRNTKSGASFGALDDLTFVIGGSSVQPPAAPSNPGPADAAKAVAISPTLSWDAAAAGVTFDVYFGTSATPATLVASAQSAATFAPTGLNYNTMYYWQVVAAKDGLTAAGSVWSFLTKIQGDISNDSYVNVGDLQLLVAAWGSQGSGLAADVNSDTYVNVGDLQLLVADWGKNQ